MGPGQICVKKGKKCVMATLIKQALNPIGIGALCLSAVLAPAHVFAAASSSGRVVFSNVEFVDLDKDDGLSPGIVWLGKIDGVLDAAAAYALTDFGRWLFRTGS